MFSFAILLPFGGQPSRESVKDMRQGTRSMIFVKGVAVSVAAVADAGDDEGHDFDDDAVVVLHDGGVGDGGGHVIDVADVALAGDDDDDAHAINNVFKYAGAAAIAGDDSDIDICLY